MISSRNSLRKGEISLLKSFSRLPADLQLEVFSHLPYDGYSDLLPTEASPEFHRRWKESSWVLNAWVSDLRNRDFRYLALSRDGKELIDNREAYSFHLLVRDPQNQIRIPSVGFGGPTRVTWDRKGCSAVIFPLSESWPHGWYNSIPFDNSYQLIPESWQGGQLNLSVEFSPSNQAYVLQSYYEHLREPLLLWRPLQKAVSLPQIPVSTEARLSPCVTKLHTFLSDHSLKVYDLITQQEYASLSGQRLESKVTWTDDERYLAWGDSYGTVRSTDLISHRSITFVVARERRIDQLIYSPEGRRIALITGPRMEIWDLCMTQHPWFVFPSKHGCFLSLDWKGDHLVVANKKKIYLFSV